MLVFMSGVVRSTNHISWEGIKYVLLEVQAVGTIFHQNFQEMT